MHERVGRPSDMHRAGAAHADATAELRAGEADESRMTHSSGVSSSTSTDNSAAIDVE